MVHLTIATLMDTPFDFVWILLYMMPLAKTLLMMFHLTIAPLMDTGYTA